MSRRKCVRIARYIIDLAERMSHSLPTRTMLGVAQALRRLAMALEFGGIVDCGGPLNDDVFVSCSVLTTV